VRREEEGEKGICVYWEAIVDGHKKEKKKRRS
jgi:hypothetical protein